MPKKSKAPIGTKDRHTDVAEQPRRPTNNRQPRMAVPFAEPWSSAKVSENRVSLFSRPLSRDTEVTTEALIAKSRARGESREGAAVPPLWEMRATFLLVISQFFS